MTEIPQIYVYRGILERIGALPARPWEVGGWLLGYYDEDENVFALTHATPPSRGTPFHVHISARRHRPYFDQAYEATEGNITYIGDWHTHPGGHPSPSKRDEEAMTQIDESSDFGDGPVLISISSTSRWPGRKRIPTETRFYALIDEEPLLLKPKLIDELEDPECRVPTWPWPSIRKEEAS